MAVSATDVQKAYLAYFGRPADPVGLAYWQTSDAATMKAGFAASDEYAALYSGMSATQRVSQVYTNLLGRSADAAGLVYWAGELAAGRETVATLVDSMMTNALGDDITTINNRVTYATAFTTALDTAAEIVGYSGDSAAAAARTAIASVTTDASLTTAQAALATTVSSIVTTGTSSSGTTYTLTTSVDTVTGTSNNDTFNGLVDYTAGGTATSANTTFNVSDTVNGGAGTDTLVLTVTGAATGPSGAVTLPAATVTGIENVNVRAVTGSGQIITVAGANFSGHTAMNADRSTDAVTFTGVASGASVGVFGNGLVTNGATTATYVTSATAPVLNIEGGTVGTGAISITAAGASSMTINSTGSNANSVGAITAPATATSMTIDAAAGLTTSGITAVGVTALTVTGAASSNITPTVAGASTAAVNIGAASVATTTIDASGMTAGGLGVTLIAGISSFKGGQGADNVTTSSVGLTSTTASIIDAGAGTDTLTVAATADVSTAAKADLYANFETLNLAAGQTADMSLFSKSTITSIMLGGTTAGATNLSATQAANINIYANESTPTIGVKDATVNGNLDTINFTFDDGLAAKNTLSLGAFAAAGVETINVVANDNATLTSLANATALTGMTVTGAGNVSITTAALAANPNTVIDASAVTGTVTLSAAAATTNGLKLEGSSTKANTITGSAQADTLIGGSAADTFVTSGGADTITTGAGGDTITVSSTGATPSASSFITITDYNKTAGTTTFDKIGAATLVLGTQTAAAGPGVATLTSGVATFNAADTTFAQHLTAVDAALQVAAGATAVWQEGADAYVFISNGVAGLDSADTLIKLTGVTAGALTVAGNQITAMA